MVDQSQRAAKDALRAVAYAAARLCLDVAAELRGRLGEPVNSAQGVAIEVQRADLDMLAGDHAAALARLEQHAWPGNIRELKNAIDSAALICPDDEIGIEHLPLAQTAATSGSLHADVDALEKTRILAALDACGGNQTRAAQQLGISRGTLVSRLKQYGIRRPRG